MKNTSIEELIFKIFDLKSQNNDFTKVELNHLMHELELIIERFSNENSNENLLSKKAIFILRNLNKDEFVDSGHGIDYTLKIVERKPLINKQTHPRLFYLICLPKEKKKAIIRENNGMGYHIHYVVVKNKKQCRTNIVFTFNPKFSDNHANPKLYWERHGQGLEKYPEKFKARRKMQYMIHLFHF